MAARAPAPPTRTCPSLDPQPQVASAPSRIEPFFRSPGAFAAGLRIDQIAHRIGPGSFQERLDFSEEGIRQTIERIAAPAPCSSRPAKMQHSCAATLIPWPKIGVKRQSESPIGISPRGKRSSLSKARRTLANILYRAISPTALRCGSHGKSWAYETNWRSR